MYRNLWYIIVTLVFIFAGCTKGLEPIPASFDISMSWSLPIGTGQVSFDKALQTTGIPILNPGEDVPDWAHFPYVFFQDTLPLNLTEVYNRDSTIDYMEFQLNLWNQFPVKGKAQLFFIDPEGVKIDSLNLEGYFEISEGSVLKGVVLKERYRNYTLKFSDARIESLKSSDRIVIEAGILPDESISSDNVQYFSKYNLKIQVGVRVDFKIEDI